MIPTQSALVLLASLLPAAQPSPLSTSEGKSKWGDEFCRTRFCAVMSFSQQDQCCDAYNQCCAYVEMYKKADPFSYLESHEVAETPPPPPTQPPTTPEAVTFSHRDIYVGLPKSMRLRDEENLSQQPPSLSLTRHDNNDPHPHPHRHHHHRRPSTPQPRPAIELLDGGEDLMKTSYNDQLVKGQKRVCKHSYCSLLSTGQQKLCCNIYDTCCAYAEYRKVFDLFHPDNGSRRR